ncbi:YEATS domain-containing protein 4, variant 2 [Balamuthia mandrillaris]
MENKQSNTNPHKRKRRSRSNSLVAAAEEQHNNNGSVASSSSSSQLPPSSSSSPSPSSKGGGSKANKTKRLKGVVVERAVVYGNKAWWLGKKADELHTHRWTAFVRGPAGDEDISYFVKKVVFTLHPSFKDPVRVVDKPPFEITETGWGEFELAIRIHFVDASERPVDLYHPLVLYPLEPEGPALVPGTVSDAVRRSEKIPVIRENYDEIVFKNPTEYFNNILQEHKRKVAAKSAATTSVTATTTTTATSSSSATTPKKTPAHKKQRLSKNQNTQQASETASVLGISLLLCFSLCASFLFLYLTKKFRAYRSGAKGG